MWRREYTIYRPNDEFVATCGSSVATCGEFINTATSFVATCGSNDEFVATCGMILIFTCQIPVLMFFRQLLTLNYVKLTTG